MPRAPTLWCTPAAFGEAGAEWVAVFFIAVALLQNLLYILQLALAAHALARAPPAGEANLLWSRYSDLYLPALVSRAGDSLHKSSD